MNEIIPVVGAAIGGMVGMGAALGYGAKKLVDVLSKQLQTQNGMIEKLHYGIKGDLDRHIEDCKICQSKAVVGAAQVIADAAKAAAQAVTDAAKAAAKVVHDV